jgi:hypothetical protein
LAFAIILGPRQSVQGALPVLFQRFALPGKDGRRFITGNGGGSVILSRKDVARAPADIASELLKGFDQDGRLNGHVQRSRNAGVLERLGRTVFGTARHETRHFNLGELNVLATIVGKRNIGNCIGVIAKSSRPIEK